MIYNNNESMALSAMESERLGNYGDCECDEALIEKCPVCNAFEPEYFYLDDNEECVGCSECICKTHFLP